MKVSNTTLSNELADPHWGMSLEEVEEWKRRSETGDPEASARYAACLRFGYTEKPVYYDEYASQKVLEKISGWATENWRTSAWAAYSAGLCWELGLGKGICKDRYRSVDAFQSGANKRHPQSLVKLGKIYTLWRGKDNHIIKACQCFDRAVEIGDYDAICHMSYCVFEVGRVREALEQWQRLAPYHLISLVAFAVSLFLGVGVEKDEARSIVLLQDGAYSTDYPFCKFTLAKFLIERANSDQDEEKARQLITENLRDRHYASLNPVIEFSWNLDLFTKEELLSLVEAGARQGH